MKEQQTLFDATVEDTESKKISDEIKRLVCKVAEIQLQNEWSEPEPINAKNKFTDLGYKFESQMKPNDCRSKLIKTGVYIISHHGKVMYVGMGNLKGRRNIHIKVFKNDGKPHVYNSTTDSPCARKMFNHDPQIDNWKFSYLVVDPTIDRGVRDGVMKEMEKRLVEEFKPPFCTSGMVGK